MPSMFSNKILKQFIRTRSSLKFKVALFFIFIYFLTSILMNIHHGFIESPRKNVYEQLQTQNPEYVFIGSSRFYTGINLAEVPSPSFILSLPFAGALTLKRLVQSNLERLKLAKIVVIELAPEMFYVDSLAVNPGQYIKLLDQGVKTSVLERLLKIRRPNDVNTYFPGLDRLRLTPREIIQLKKNKKRRELTSTQDKKLYNYGFFPLSKAGTRTQIEDSTKEHLTLIGRYFNRELIQTYLNHYREMTSLLKSNDIPFVTVSMPIVPQYALQRQKNWDHLFSNEFKKLKNKLPYIKVGLEMTGLTLDHFADTNHLNLDGSARATKYLVESLNNLRTN